MKSRDPPPPPPPPSAREDWGRGQENVGRKGDERGGVSSSGGGGGGVLTPSNRHRPSPPSRCYSSSSSTLVPINMSSSSSSSSSSSASSSCSSCSHPLPFPSFPARVPLLPGLRKRRRRRHLSHALHSEERPRMGGVLGLISFASLVMLLAFAFVVTPHVHTRTAMPPITHSRLNTYCHGYPSPSLSSAGSTPPPPWRVQSKCESYGLDEANARVKLGESPTSLPLASSLSAAATATTPNQNPSLDVDNLIQNQRVFNLTDSINAAAAPETPGPRGLKDKPEVLNRVSSSSSTLSSMSTSSQSIVRGNMITTSSQSIQSIVRAIGTSRRGNMITIIRACARKSGAEEEGKEQIEQQEDKEQEQHGMEFIGNRDDWEALGLLPGADPERIRKAYRALVKLHHPDTGGDEQRFELIKSAFERLMGRASKIASSAAMANEADRIQQQIQPLIEQGMNLYDMNDIGSAARQLKDALKLWKEKGLPIHPKGRPFPFWVLVLANNLIGMQRAIARECARQGDFQAALLLYREALELNKDYTRSTYMLIYILNQMAQLEGALGRHKQAKGYFFEALDISEAEVGKPLQGEVMANLANDYNLEGDLVNALKAYDRALEIFLDRKRMSDSAPAFLNNTSESTTILKKKTLVTDPLSQVGRNYVILCSRAIAEAMESPTDTVGIQKCGYFLRDHCSKTEPGQEGLAYGLLLKAWGTGMARAGNKTVASILLSKAVEILTVHLGESLEIADAIQEIGVCQFDMGEQKKAFDNWIIAYQMMANAHGGSYQNVETAQIGTKIAAALLTKGDEPDKALDFLAITLSTLLKLLSPTDSRIVNAQQLITVARNQLFERDGVDPELDEEKEFLDPEWNAIGAAVEGKSGIFDWNEKQVLDWAKYVNLNDETIEVLQKQCMDGPALATYDVNEMIQDGIPRGQAIKIRRFVDQDKIREFQQRQAEKELDEQASIEKGKTVYPRPEEIKNPNDLDLLGADITVDMIGSVLPAKWKDEKVACKVVSGSSEGLEAMRTFLKIPTHPHCVELTGVAVVNEFILLVMPWYEAGTVREAYVNTTEGKKITESPLEFIQKIALPSAEGLAHLHAHTILHRDICGQNMLVSNGEGKAVLHEWRKAKFGKKRFEGLEGNGDHHLRWIAPEGIAGNFSTASDVWSLAVSWSEVLNQDEDPYSGQTTTAVVSKVCAGRLIPKLKPEVKDRLPIPFQQLYRGMLRKNPRDRPDAREILAKLRFLEAKLKVNPEYGVASTDVSKSEDSFDKSTDDP